MQQGVIEDSETVEGAEGVALEALAAAESAPGVPTWRARARQLRHWRGRSWFFCVEACREALRDGAERVPVPCRCAASCGCRSAAAAAGPAGAGERLELACTWLINALQSAIDGCVTPGDSRRAAAARARLRTLFDATQYLVGAHTPQARALAAPGAALWPRVRPPRRGRGHAASLPDLAPLIAQLSYTEESSQRATLPLVHALSKLVPSRCLFRGFQEAVLRLFEKEPDTRDLFCQLLRCSMDGGLGLPDRCGAAPEFAVMLELDWHFGPDAPAQIHGWVTAYPHVVFYALKEALVYYVRLSDALRHVLCECYDGWDVFEVDVHRVCESVRASLADGAWCDVLRNCEARTMKQSGGAPYVFKLRKRGWYVTLQMCLQKALDRRGVTTARVRAATEPTVADLARCISRLTRHDLCRWHRELLELAGCDAQVARVLSELRADYFRDGLSPSVVHKALAFASDDDVARALVMVKFCITASQVDCVPTDCATASRQIDALRTRLGVLPNRPLPESAGGSYVCLQCGKDGPKWKCPEDRPDEVWSIGPYDVFEDNRSVDSTVLCCNRKANGAGCGGARVSLVNMVGRWLLHYGSWYTLCPVCASPTTWSHARVARSGIGFCCGVCAEDAVRYRQELAAQAEREPWWEPPSATVQTHKCFYCDEPRLAGHDDWAEMRVAADSDPMKSIRVTLCVGCSHARSGKWATQTQRLGVTESSLRQHISKARSFSSARQGTPYRGTLSSSRALSSVIDPAGSGRGRGRGRGRPRGRPRGSRGRARGDKWL